MIKKLLILLSIFLLSATQLFAYEIGSILGTSASDTIMGYTVTVNYYSSGDAKVTDNSVSSIPVDAIYGFDIVLETVTTNGIEPDQTATYSYLVRNVGNEATNIIKAVTTDSTINGDFTVESSADQTMSPGSTYNFVVSHNALATATPDAQVTMNIELVVSENVGGLTAKADYTGFNGNIYGGYTDIYQLVRTWIKIAVMNITKNYEITLDGSSSDPVPGATVLFNITYSNDGSSTANNIVFTDLIPTANTDFKLNSTGNVCTQPGVTATYSYQPTDNTLYNYNPVENGPTTNSGVDEKVNAIKIELSEIGPGESGTINYSVVIQ